MRYSRILILAIAQALGNAGLALVVLLGGLIGASLAPNPGLATLPTSLHMLGVALATVPAALVMQRYGRRRGFVGAAILAAFAAVWATDAIIQRNFSVVCIALFLIGINGAFIQQYRFAASESVPPRYAGRAVSLVLIGGIASGLLGPQLAQHATNLIASSAYAGAFVGLAVCYGVSAAILSFFEEPVLPTNIQPVRPIRQIVRQPLFLIAVLAGAVGYAVMGLMMTAVPLQMVRLNGFGLDDAAWVIESHFVAMFLPSLFTGVLIDWLGMLRMMLVGLVSLAICTLIALFSQHLLHYWVTMLLLGFGWNLLFVGGTVLLARTYMPAERFKIQAVNDCLIFGVQACASFVSGTLLFWAGWVALNLFVIPLLILMGIGLWILRQNQHHQRHNLAILRDLLEM